MLKGTLEMPHLSVLSAGRVWSPVMKRYELTASPFFLTKHKTCLSRFIFQFSEFTLV